MRILHYFLGFPPYRSGGLTKFAVDLASSQIQDGHEVIALWPGQIKNYSAQPSIKERARIEGIQNFELINPLPISLDEGISEFGAFTKSCDINIYRSFLEKIKPDVIHIHTLMGFHREFIQAANQTNIRTVMTTHDYFGLCPKVTLYRNGKCCDNDDNCNGCIQCNQSALSLKKIQLMQSPLYRGIKNFSLIKSLRKIHRKRFFEETTNTRTSLKNTDNLASKYQDLRIYYTSILESIDFIHFNSSITESVYNRFIKPKNSKVISITHQGIKPHLRKKKPTDKKVILFLAPAKPFKGWNVLKSACDQLFKNKVNFELQVYSTVPKIEPYMVINENGFKHSNLEDIMCHADILIAPSIWYETFGFTVLEALSFGVPVIVSDHVGAKDIIGNFGIVVPHNDVDSLYKAITNFFQDDTSKNDPPAIKTWSVFKSEILDIYTNN